MLIDAKKYSGSLKNLWSEVFGDSDEYISLIFDKGYIPAEVFGEISDGRVVSALYLLKCNITSDGRIYNGRYLYAAATLTEYRKNGIMARLINEAEEFIVNNNIDFIALVPASEKLYGYYAKYGFESLMYKYLSVTEKERAVFDEDEIISFDEYFELRKLYGGNKFSFEKSETEYAASCLDFAGYRIYRNSDDSYYISDTDKTEVIEYLSSQENFKYNTEKFLSKLESGTEISSPYDLNRFCQSKKIKFGMIYTEKTGIRKSVENGVYMNIALD